MDEKVLKKAMRKYLKDKRQFPDQEWTPFRAAEKRFKALFPPPDLQTVLDLRASSPDESAQSNQRVTGNPNFVPTKVIGTNSKTDQKATAYTVPNIPGLIILPNYLTSDQQKELIRWSLHTQAREVNGTNLDVHYQVPEEGIWSYYTRSRGAPQDLFIVQPKRPSESEPLVYSPEGPRPLIENAPVDMENFHAISTEPKPLPSPSTHLRPIHVSKLLTKLRWANIGYYYHWGSKSYDFTRPKSDCPEFLKSLCRSIINSIEWKEVWNDTDVPEEEWGEGGPDWESWHESYEPDAGIVNFYQPGDLLCGHVDRSEVCATSPLVSISLGNSAIFLMGGLTRSVTPIPILLRSGDIIIMSGPRCRRAFHGVPKIFNDTLPHHLHRQGDDPWEPFADYLQNARININVRQVFPRGFNPFKQQADPMVQRDKNV